MKYVLLYNYSFPGGKVNIIFQNILSKKSEIVHLRLHLQLFFYLMNLMGNDYFLIAIPVNPVHNLMEISS